MRKEVERCDDVVIDAWRSPSWETIRTWHKSKEKILHEQAWSNMGIPQA